jgi:hypothetical protein
VSFVAITLCVASQRVFIVVSVYFVIDSVRKLLDMPSYIMFILFHFKEGHSVLTDIHETWYEYHTTGGHLYF